MTTIQILTRNNSKTIRACIESLRPLNAEVVVGDLDSSDDTVSQCDQMGAITHRLGKMNRHEARNQLAQDGVNLAVEPWEVLAQGDIAPFQQCSYVSVLNNKTITKDIRLWKPPLQHIQPTFEQIDAETSSHSNLIFYCIGNRDYGYDKEVIEQWKKNPLTPQPYYYQACIDLALGNYSNFFMSANHYLFMDRSKSMSAVMLRYYLAYVYLMKSEAKPTLQNINLCLCERPLMAEFWCLMADVYYHLLKDFRKATEFYENAITLGSYRRKTDTWPMDLVKYKEYPTKMITSCEKLINPSFYAQ